MNGNFYTKDFIVNVFPKQQILKKNFKKFANLLYDMGKLCKFFEDDFENVLLSENIDFTSE